MENMSTMNIGGLFGTLAMQIRDVYPKNNRFFVIGW